MSQLDNPDIILCPNDVLVCPNDVLIMSEKTIKQIQDKEVVIREMNQNDLQRAQAFTAFFNALIKEGAPILFSEPRTRQQISKWLKRSWAGVRKKRTIMLIGECQGSIVARAEISPQIGHR